MRKLIFLIPVFVLASCSSLNKNESSERVPASFYRDIIEETVSVVELAKVSDAKLELVESLEAKCATEVNGTQYTLDLFEISYSPSLSTGKYTVEAQAYCRGN